MLILRLLASKWMVLEKTKPRVTGYSEQYQNHLFLCLDRLDSNSERRWVGEDDVNESTLKIYLSLEARDKRRWTVADR